MLHSHLTKITVWVLETFMCLFCVVPSVPWK